MANLFNRALALLPRYPEHEACRDLPESEWTLGLQGAADCIRAADLLSEIREAGGDVHHFEWMGSRGVEVVLASGAKGADTYNGRLGPWAKLAALRAAYDRARGIRWLR